MLRPDCPSPEEETDQTCSGWNHGKVHCGTTLCRRVIPLKNSYICYKLVLISTIMMYSHCGIYIRMLELKHEMMNLELLEFHYFDDILADMKLTPVSLTYRIVPIRGLLQTVAPAVF